MRDLDEAPHRNCFWCGKMAPHARMLNFNDHHFCGITCKMKQEESDDDALYRAVRPAVIPFRGNGK